MTAKTMVLTGASDGIGRAAARILHGRGERVVLVGRSPDKTEALAKELGADFHVADFARLAQVRALAATLLERYPVIDVLANNAGGIMGSRTVTPDGHEMTFQVNHLAPFLLTTLLLPRLADSRATVINTSSMLNMRARLDLDDLDNERHYSGNRAYADAKLANILFTRELQRRHGASGLTAVSFHPGVVATNFSGGTDSLARFLYHTPLKRLLLTPERGADTLVWLATTPPGAGWEPGGHYEKRRPSRTHPMADDAAAARLLWERSEAMLAH
ncbi:SDR family NAD(P)-dependent oxidoreductase (plasmid) [Actinomadura sp. ATCC 31491]|uniref:SDR family NAD(P)-dependent oxidoreductase n=1 Tax=Actinomadura luzonensis TaxID=2805427 RepID=A0ABT0GCQ1_9ACTN|nr:SDR family NAD(P)-dependent oxidoreductase [Actinomadura luzonensis]MCK2222030.1 SDR family NAD(P)-dependent oxidoreductase [Actinomadura luzonensis]